MTSLLNERREVISSLISVAENAFGDLKQALEIAQNDEDLANVRFAIGQSVFPLNLAHEALKK
jgi:hypothetical protein